MTPDTKVRVASITKLLVSMGAYFSVEDGTMTLDGSIGDALGYSIGVHSSKDVLSARSIMTHTSSTGYLEGNGGSYNYIRNMLESGRGVQYINSGSLDNWCYNNFAFYVLGMAVELANNKEFDVYMREKLFDEMNIDAGVWAGDLKEPEKTATVYNSSGSVGLSYDYQISRHARGVGVNGSPFAGNLHISAYDLGKIIAILANDGCYDDIQRIDPDIITEIETYEPRKVYGNKFYQAQPLRYQEDIYWQKSLYYHTGSAYGEYTLCSYNPETKCGVVVLTTGAYGSVDKYGIYSICGKISELLYNS